MVLPAKRLSFPAALQASARLLPGLFRDEDAQPTQGSSHALPVVHFGSLARSNIQEVVGLDPQNNPNPRQMLGPDVLVPPRSPPHHTEVTEVAAEALPPPQTSILQDGVQCSLKGSRGSTAIFLATFV